MNKSELRRAILAALEAERAQQTAAAQLARDEAISEESRPESKYDTHSQEAAYLAEGQARLANEISQSIAQYTSLPLPDLPAGASIALGAVVSIGERQRPTWYFIGPRAGGLQLTAEGRELLVVTPQSPLGRQLLGKTMGESVTLPGRKAPLPILTVE